MTDLRRLAAEEMREDRALTYRAALARLRQSRIRTEAQAAAYIQAREDWQDAMQELWWEANE